MPKFKSLDVLCVRLSEEEYQAFSQLAQKSLETRSALLRKAIREMINVSLPDLLQEEQIMVRVIIRHLVGIGNNLNQIAHKVNSGVISHQRMDIPYLNTIYSQVQNLKKAFRYYLNITRKRFVVTTNYEVLNDNLQSAR